MPRETPTDSLLPPVAVRPLALWLLVAAGLGLAQPAARAISDIPPGTTLWLQGLDNNAPTGGFQIGGTLRLEAIDEPADITLNTTIGLVTNLSSGLILSGAGAGGQRTFYTSIQNAGTFDIKTTTFFSRPNSSFSNTGHFLAEANSGVYFVGGNQVFDQIDGLLDLITGIYFAGGTFNYRGGTISGPGVPYLVNSALHVWPGGTNSAFFVMNGPFCHLTSDLLAGQILDLQPNDPAQPTVVTLASGLANYGTLRLESAGAAADASVQITDAPLTNTLSGVIQCLPGAGGQREIAGNLLNLGTLVVNTDLTLRALDEAHTTNRGAINIATNATLEVNEALTQAAGQITLNGGALSATTLTTHPVVITNIVSGTNVLVTNLVTVTNLNRLSLDGGTLAGNGIVNARLINAAGLRLSAAQGLLAVSGDYTQTPAGVLTLDLSNLSSTSAIPVLTVSSNLQLAGTLRILLTNPPAFPRGAAYVIARGQSVSGGFATNLFDSFSPTNTFAVVYETNAVKLLVLRRFLEVSDPRFADDGRFHLTVTGPAGGSCQVETSTNLVDWSVVETVKPFAGTLDHIEMQPTKYPQRFYRAYRSE